MTQAEQYIQDVVEGNTPSCKWVRLAVERHLKDLERKDFPYYFDKEAGNKALTIVSKMRHTQGKWAKQFFQTGPDQAFAWYCIFGWKKKSDNKRRFTKVYKEVARKRGKTEDAAATALLCLIFDAEFGAEVYTGATKRDQAKICFDRAKVMARMLKADSPALNKLIGIHKYNVHVHATESKLEPLSADSDKLDGLNPHCAIIDEYHAHRTDDLIKVIETGMGAREQPLLYIITTAGFNLQGPCYQYRKVCCDVLEGKKTDDNTFAIIYTLDEDDDWEQEENWQKANPAIGVTPSWDYMRSMYQKAKNEGAAAEIQFKTKNLNIWTGTHATWIEDDVWMSCSGDLPALSGRECYGGLDLASVGDIAALVLTFPPDEEGGAYIQKYVFWCSEKQVQTRSAQDGVPYLDWVRLGYIRQIPGEIIDDRVVIADIVELAKKYHIKLINYDLWGSKQVSTELQENGAEMEGFGQGYKSMSQPTKDFEKLARSGKILHDSNPVMRWMMGNVALKFDPAGNIKIDKDKSSEKVDGPVAAVMSLAGAMQPKQDTVFWGFA